MSLEKTSQQGDLLVKASRVIISAAFLLLLYHRIADFKNLYFKFSIVDFIYENKLQSLFYLFGAIEFLTSLLVFFARIQIIRLILDVCFGLYTSFNIAYFLSLFASDLCLECNYYATFFHEQAKVTLGILVLLTLLYVFVIRPFAIRRNDVSHPLCD
jgi:hypothetical protein